MNQEELARRIAELPLEKRALLFQQLQNQKAHEEPEQPRIARVNRDGWLLEAAKSSQASRPRVAAEAGHSLRRTIGHTLVHCGEWLQGAPDVESTAPAPIKG